MGAFISRLTSPQAITAAIVWLYTKLFVGKCPVRPYANKAFSISQANSSATQELVPVALFDRRDSIEDLQSVGPRLEESRIITSVELESPERCRPANMSPATKSMKALDDAEDEMRTPTLILSPGSELLDDSGLSQSAYSDITDSVGFPKHMLQTTSSLMNRRRKAHNDVKVSPSTTSRLSAKRSKRSKTEKTSAPETSKRLVKATERTERSYLRQTASSRLKCRQKLNLKNITALPASSCA